MADDQLNDLGSATAADTADPLSDSFIPNETPSLDPAGQAEEPVAPSFTFGDLPFKSQDEAVQAYKNLQNSYVSAQSKQFELAQQLATIGPYLQQLQAQKVAQGATPAEAQEDVAAALKAFIEGGPSKTFKSFVENNRDLFKDPRVDKMQERFETMQKENEINNFIAAHPEVTEQDERDLIQVIQRTPWIANMNGPLAHKLDAAWNVLVARDPKGYVARTATPVVDPALQAAKAGASTLGGKAGGKGAIVANKDEFDEVLSQSRDERGRWK
jgi:hypothetical protein